MVRKLENPKIIICSFSDYREINALLLMFVLNQESHTELTSLGQKKMRKENIKQSSRPCKTFIEV